MKTAVVIADTHGNKADLKKLGNIMREADYIIHLGDGYYDLNAFGQEVLEKTVRIKGNCDDAVGDRETIVEIEGVKLFLTHGDLYGVRGGTNRLLARAKELGASVALYGHTHAALIEERSGVTIANPGTLTRYAPQKTFIYAVFSGGKAVLKINDGTLS